MPRGGQAPFSTRRDDDDDDDDDSEEDIVGAGGVSEEEADLFGFDMEREHAALSHDDAGDADNFGAEVSRSPFGPETFPTAAACWEHAAKAHSFSLQRLRVAVGTGVWNDYHRIRLVNHLRSLGPDRARIEAPNISADSPIWQDDKLLQPVLEDDQLLWEDVDDGQGVDNNTDSAAAACESMSGTGAAAPSQVDPAELVAEVARLRAELAATRRLLTEADADLRDGVIGGTSDLSAADDFDLDRCRAMVLDPGMGKAFQEFALASPALFQGKVVLDAGCGAGVLSCICAQLGATRVLAVDPSPTALALARDIVAENGFGAEVTLLRGRTDEGFTDKSASSCGGKKGERYNSHGVGSGGGLLCDILTSERFFSDLRYSPLLLSFLDSRRCHLRPGGRVIPGRIALRVCAGDFLGEVERNEMWQQRGPLLGNLSVAALASKSVSPPVAESRVAVGVDNVASLEAAELLNLDLATASPEDALLSNAAFRLRLRADRCTTALVLYLEADLGDGHGRGGLSMAPAPPACSSTSLPRPRSSPQRQQTVLHLPGPGPHPASALRLPGVDFQVLEGSLSAVWSPNRTSIEIHVDLSAAEHREGGSGGGRSSGGAMPLLPERVIFSVMA